ncbi:MAG: hypothetical protein AB2417_18780 [Clostridiaceae bacterium]
MKYINVEDSYVLGRLCIFYGKIYMREIKEKFLNKIFSKSDI